jgi:rRNA-processing protein FCF1
VGNGKLAQDFKENLDGLNRKKYKNKRNNNLFDAFMAESAEIHNLILATNDTELFKFVSKRGGAVVNFYFLEQLMKNSLKCSETPAY